MNDFTFDDHENEKRRRYAQWIAKGGIVLFFVVNALLTGVYGAFSVLSTFPPGIQETFEVQALIVLSAIITAVILVILLDGSRFIWSMAAIAPQTSGVQQALARGTEVAMIAASTVASVLALRVLLNLIGMVSLSQVELDNAGSLLVWIFSAALLLDFVAGWLYNFTSPKQKSIRAESRREAFGLDTVSKQSEYQLEAAKRALPEALEKDHPSLVAQLRDAVRNNVVSSLQIDTPRQAIPRVAASEQPNRMNGIQGRGENERRRGIDPK